MGSDNGWTKRRERYGRRGCARYAGKPIVPKDKKPFVRHTLACPAYGNYQPPYEDCTCGADDEAPTPASSARKKLDPMREQCPHCGHLEEESVPSADLARLLQKWRDQSEHNRREQERAYKDDRGAAAALLGHRIDVRTRRILDLEDAIGGGRP